MLSIDTKIIDVFVRKQKQTLKKWIALLQFRFWKILRKLGRINSDLKPANWYFNTLH